MLHDCHCIMDVILDRLQSCKFDVQFKCADTIECTFHICSHSMLWMISSLFIMWFFYSIYMLLISILQGVSLGNWIFKLALRDRRANIFLIYGALWLQEVRIFVFHQPVFKKMTSAGLNSLRQEEYQILVKNWIFDDPFHKKKNCIGHFCARVDDATIRSNKLFDEMRLLKSLRPLRLLRP